VSVESIALVLNHSKAKGTAKVVLIGIANHDGDGGAWPSVETLAHYAQVSIRATQDAIQQLVALGEIRVEVNGGGREGMRKDRRPNRYFILVEPSQDGVKQTAPRESDGVKPSAERGEDDRTPPMRDGVKQASPEPSLEPPLKEVPPKPPASGGPSKRLCIDGSIARDCAFVLQPRACSQHDRHRRDCQACHVPAPKPLVIPPWCGKCDPAGEDNPGQRLVGSPDVGLLKCPLCHPAMYPPELAVPPQLGLRGP